MLLEKLGLQGRKLLNNTQEKEIMSGVISNFDISLFSVLLQHFGALSKSAKEDLSIVRRVRNETSHLPADRLKDHRFNDMFSCVSKALISSFKGDPSDIQHLRIAPVDEADLPKIIQHDETAIQRAKDCKEEGNRKFRAERYLDAIQFYTQALQLSGVLPLQLQADLWCNRSCAYGKLKKWNDAQNDATHAVNINPSGMRGHQRLGEALVGLGLYADASLSFERAVLYAEKEDDRSLMKKTLHETQVMAEKKSRKEEINTSYTPGAFSRGLFEKAMTARAGKDGTPALPRNTKTLSEEMLKLLPSNPKTPGEKWLVSHQHVCLAHAARDSGHLEEAVQEYAIAAEMENAEGMYNLAVCIMEGRGTLKNVKLAEMWLRRAVDQPIPEINFGGIAKDAVAQGTAAAWNSLGNFYAHGIGSFQKDIEEALKCYQKSAELGYHGGMNNLGVYYMDGLGGLDLDFNLAREWFLRASERGNNEAMHNLGFLCERNLDFEGAVRWYQSSLDHGNLGALEGLERASKRGTSTQPDGSIDPVVKQKLLELVKVSMMPAPTPNFHFDVSLTLQHLEQISPRKRYLDLLTSARSILESSLTNLMIASSNADFSMIVQVLSQFSGALLIPDWTLVCGPRVQIIRQVAEQFLPHLSKEVTRLYLTICSHLKSSNASVAHLRKVVSEDPDNIDAILRLGCLVMFEGPNLNIEEGIKLLTLAVTRLKKNFTTDVMICRLIDAKYLLGIALTKSKHKLEQQQGVTLLEDFLKVAVDFGHRKVPKAFFYLARSQMLNVEKSVHSFEDARHLYEKGMAALNDLPPFLRSHEENSGYEKLLQVAFGNAATSIFSGPSSIQHCYGGYCLPSLRSSIGTLMQPQVGVTIRLKNLRAQHFGPLSKVKQFKITGDDPSMILNVTKAPFASVWSGSEQDDKILKNISIEELMAPRRDQVLNNCVVTVVIVSMAIRMSSIMMLVEDANRDAILLAVYNVNSSDEHLWFPGRIVRIRNPYARLSADDQTMIRVDNPKTTCVLSSDVVQLCWYCLKTGSQGSQVKLLLCAKCKKASYCSKECQAKDWTENFHKSACQFALKGKSANCLG